MRTIILPALFMLSSNPAFAHGLERQAGRAAWTFDPWIVSPLVVFALLYISGAAVLARRAVHTRVWHHLSCVAGWFTLAAALVSPLHWLGERLFTFHMIEHEIIMAVSAPLLVIARPVGTLLWSLPRRLRLKVGGMMRHHITRRLWDWLSAGRNATLLHAIAIWAWHAPALFDATIDNVFLHRLQHLSFFVTAVLFWWSVFRRSEAGAAAWHVFITMLHTSALGALMALAPRVLYQQQTAAAAAWGLTPLEDQQLAGIIMWVPAGTIYAGAALALIAVWIKDASRNADRRDAASAY
ncbi:cytochrome c oxidase assembly protein [Afipia sp. TerB]